MAQWKVTKEKIELFDHPDADSLQIGKVGQYQVVVQSGLYSNDDEVFFVPEKSVLPDSLAEPYRNYLRGPSKDRVGSVRLRGQLSMGVIMPVDKVEQMIGAVAIGECAAEKLGITKYEPPIPACLAGEVSPLPDFPITQHDVEQFGIYAGEFDPREIVIVTEKIHGSQVNVYLTGDGQFGLSSKGILSRGLTIEESADNLYWRAVRRVYLEQKMIAIQEFLRVGDVVPTVQCIGEVVPAQGASWSYGYSTNEPGVLLFDCRIGGESVTESQLMDPYFVDLRSLWVPVICREQIGLLDLPSLSQGMETVSGKELHIREGVVVRPYHPRRASDGTRLLVKVINPKYAKKETGEEVS